MILVFDKSYTDFHKWREKNFSYYETTMFASNNINAFYSVPKNTCFIANCSLTEDEKRLVILRYLIEIQLVPDHLKKVMEIKNENQHQSS